jgi:uncharacterized protein YcaQ
VQTLSIDSARRVALAAQGFGSPRPVGRVDRRHVRRMFDRVQVLQVDSVNVLVRAQELPLFARLGPHSRDLLPRMLDDGELFEYWGHQASLLPVRLHPLFRWRMEKAAFGHASGHAATFARERPEFIEATYADVVARGPVTASQLAPERKRRGSWWDWDDVKIALEYLFWCGRVTARRGRNFERMYVVPERVIPADVLALPSPDEPDAKRELLLLAARAHGVATAADLAYYWILKPTPLRPLIAELVEDGELLPVAVDGWKDQAYVIPGTRVPRSIDAAGSLISPFDSLAWERRRLERLFDFEYRIEIYTPAPKRVYGYYVLPFLFGERLVARVDVRADRAVSRLLVPGAYGEHHVPLDALPALAAELWSLARWLDLENVAVGERGNLARTLRAEVKRASKTV